MVFLFDSLTQKLDDYFLLPPTKQTLQNTDGGFATYENNRGYAWFEWLNPSEVAFKFLPNFKAHSLRLFYSLVSPSNLFSALPLRHVTPTGFISRALFALVSPHSPTSFFVVFVFGRCSGTS